MKANELMIGDWVLCDGKSFQIAEIGGMVCIDYENELFASLKDIEPIPLTPEILEKNGFEARWYEELVLEADEYCFALQKGVDGRNAWWWEMFSSPIIPINHIHELQHILRLCGIEKEIEL